MNYLQRLDAGEYAVGVNLELDAASFFIFGDKIMKPTLRNFYGTHGQVKCDANLFIYRNARTNAQRSELCLTSTQINCHEISHRMTCIETLTKNCRERDSRDFCQVNTV